MPETGSIARDVLQAVEFAAHKHRDQRRRGVEASPYINHPIQVAELLSRVGEVDDLATLIAAVLHDTVEDTETTLYDLEDAFGSEIRDLVDEVTLTAGDYDRALEAFNQRLDAFGIENVDMEAIVNAVRDPTLKAATFDSIEALQGSGLNILPVLLYSMLDEYEKAFAVVSETLDDDNYGALYVFWTPEMSGFRQRPEFIALMRRLRLDEYWREYGWPTYCQPVGDTFECQ